MRSVHTRHFFSFRNVAAKGMLWQCCLATLPKIIHYTTLPQQKYCTIFFLCNIAQEKYSAIFPSNITQEKSCAILRCNITQYFSCARLCKELKIYNLKIGQRRFSRRKVAGPENLRCQLKLPDESHNFDIDKMKSIRCVVCVLCA